MQSNKHNVPADRLHQLKKLMPWSEATLERFLENAGDHAAEWVERMLDTSTGRFRPFLVRQIYAYLINKAAQGQTTNYEAIANEFGLPNKGNQLGRTLSPLLSDIYRFCESHNQPHLTVIVVRKSGELKGIPGEGFWQLFNEGAVEPYACVTLKDRRQRTPALQADVFDYWATLGV